MSQNVININNSIVIFQIESAPTINKKFVYEGVVYPMNKCKNVYFNIETFEERIKFYFYLWSIHNYETEIFLARKDISKCFKSFEERFLFTSEFINKFSNPSKFSDLNYLRSHFFNQEREVYKTFSKVFKLKPELFHKYDLFYTCMSNLRSEEERFDAIKNNFYYLLSLSRIELNSILSFLSDNFYRREILRRSGCLKN